MRKFGIEIEFNETDSNGRTVPMETIISALNAAGIPSVREGSRFDPHGTAWNMKTDGSCGYELVSPALTMDDAANLIPLACNALRTLDLRTDSRCGLHVHISGFGNAPMHTLRNVARRIVNFEDTLDLIQPRARRGNASQYCRSNMLAHGANNVEANASIWSKVHLCKSYAALIELFNPITYRCEENSRRYHKLNLLNLNNADENKRTMEVRHGAGSINPETIVHWVRFLDAFVNVAMEQERLWRRPSDTEETQAVRFKKMTRGVPATTAKYLRRMATANNGGIDPFA